MKCDEQRNPNCARCDKGGYVCEWQDNRSGRPRLTEEKSSPSATRSPSQVTARSEDDSSAHKFFSEGIVNGVSSLFSDMAESFILDTSRAHVVSTGVSNFYFNFVYQASQSSSMIRKTLTALCGLYERSFALSHGSSPINHDYITRYSEAVTDLRTSSRELGPEIVLIASILFANCEYLMGDLCSAIQHLRAGANILNEHRTISDGRLSPELSETLGAIFEAFDHDDSIDLGSNTPGSDYLDTLTEHQFNDLHQANDDLLQIYSHTFALHKVSLNHPRHVSPAAQDFRRWTTSWRSRTSNLENSLQTEEAPWLQLLHGQHSALNTVINDLSNPADNPHPDAEPFDDLVLQVSAFLQTCSEYIDDPSIHGRPFLGNVGLVLPLFLVVLRCADSDTCETALLLLRRLYVVEGVMNSCCAHAIARSVLNSRHAVRFQRSNTSYTSNEPLPVAEIKQVTQLNSGTELDLTIRFPHFQTGFVQSESNAIIGGFCSNGPESNDRLCTILEAGGFQGAVITQRLNGCLCYESS